LQKLRGARKIHLFFAICLSVLVLSVPTFTDAFLGLPSLSDIVKGYGVVIATTITAVFAFVPALIFFVVAGITNWFTSIVLSIPIIPGSAAGNPPQFVIHGWELMRGLANMFFLLILVFIGLATILRLREYELQRTLPRLIIAALLVNFSAVLVGFIVDITNLLGSYFLSKVGGFNLHVFTSLYQTNNAASNLIENPVGSYLTTIVGGLVYGIVMFFFYLFAALAFLVVFLVFLLRTIVLWILVIFSPLAFASAVLPATRSIIWNRWWAALLQWSFIVVPVSFFLWLSLSVMTLDSQGLFSTKETPGIDLPDDPGGISGAIAQFLALAMGPIVGIFILFIGLGISMSLAPASVRAVGTFVRRAAIVTTGILGAKAILKMAENQKLRSRISNWGSSADPRWGYNKTTGEKDTGFGAGLKRRVGGIAGFGKRATGKPVERFLAKTQQNQEEKTRREAMRANDFELRSMLLQAGSGAEKRGVWAAVLQRRRTQQVFDTDTMTGTKEEREFRRARLEDDALGAYDNAVAEGDDDTAEKTQWALRHNPAAMEHMAQLENQRTVNFEDKYRDRTGRERVDSRGDYRDKDNNKVDRADQAMTLPSGVTSDEYDRGIRSFGQKVQKGARTQDEMRYFSRRMLSDEEFMKSAHDNNIWGAQQQAAFVNAFGQDGVRAFEAQKKPGADYAKLKQVGVKYIDKDGEQTPELVEGGKVLTMYGDDIATARYEVGAAAQTLGMTPKEGMERTEDVTRHRRIARKFADTLNSLDDAKVQEEVREEVQAILDEMTDLGGKENVVNMIQKDPELRKIFQDDGDTPGIKDEQARSNIAKALSDIQGNTVRQDLAGILQRNPELHDVTPQLAGIPDATQRQEVADMLQKVQDRGNQRTRSEAANVLQQNPELVNTANEIHVLASRNQELRGYKAQLKRMEDVQKLKNERGENTSVEDTGIKKWQDTIKQSEKDLNTLNRQHEQAYDAFKKNPNTAPAIPQAERLEDILSRPDYFSEAGGDGSTTGRGPSGTGGSGRTGGAGGRGPRRGGGGPRGGGGGRRRRRGTPRPVAGGSNELPPEEEPPDDEGPGGGSPAPSTPPDNTPTPSGAGAASEEVDVGDYVHYVSRDGVQQTTEPVKILRTETGPGGKKYAFLDWDSKSAIPIDELEKQEPPDNSPQPGPSPDPHGPAQPTPQNPSPALDQQDAKLQKQLEEIEQQNEELTRGESVYTSADQREKFFRKLEQLDEARAENTKLRVAAAAERLIQTAGDESFREELNAFIGQNPVAQNQDYEAMLRVLNTTNQKLARRGEDRSSALTSMHNIARDWHPYRRQFGGQFNMLRKKFGEDQAPSSFPNLNTPESFQAAYKDLQALTKKYGKDKRPAEEKNPEFIEELKKMSQQDYESTPGPRGSAQKPSRKPRKKKT